MPPPTKSPSRFLLIRTDRVGDTLLTLSAVTALREAYPNAMIHFMLRSYTQALAENYRGVDEVFLYEPEQRHKGFQGHLALAQELSAYSFDVAILFHARFELAAVVAHAGIPVRIGTAYRWYSFLFSHKIQEHRKDCLKHEVDYNLSLLAPLCPEFSHSQPQFDFELHESLISWRASTLADLGIHSEIPYAIIHAGSGASAPNLKSEQYQSLVETLLEEETWKILLTGSAQESALAESIRKGTNEQRVLNVTGEFTLEEFMSVIQGAALLLSSSTGPIHIANAFSVPILGFYCHAVPHTAKRWGPYHQQEWVLTSGVTTPKNCKLSQCPHGGCLQKLSKSALQLRLQERLKSLS